LILPIANSALSFFDRLRDFKIARYPILRGYSGQLVRS